jgi:hypothetical protein
MYTTINHTYRNARAKTRPVSSDVPVLEHSLLCTHFEFQSLPTEYYGEHGYVLQGKDVDVIVAPMLTHHWEQCTCYNV